VSKSKAKASSTYTAADLQALADRLDRKQADRGDLELAAAFIRTTLGDTPARHTFTLMNFGDAP
jgi:hypothetical protein